MNQHKYIEKNEEGPAENSFNKLIKDGIALVQELSGLKWTDYNIHDPGLTILEQLCYAITDLIYQTEFDVEDVLTDENGDIDFEQLALYKPERIFPCQPVTLTDYRKIIFDSIPDIDNVWVSKNPGVPDGLYKIQVSIKETNSNLSDKAVKQKLLEQIRECFCANRNLCEDIGSVEILENEYIELLGEIEIGSEGYAADILAEIFFRCSRRISPGMDYQPYDELLRDEKNIDEIFTGPLTRYGYIDSQKLEETYFAINMSDVIRTVRSIKGVRVINDLYIKMPDGKPFNFDYKSKDTVPCLRFPGNNAEIKVKLLKNGRDIPLDLEEITFRYNKLYFEYWALRHTTQDMSKLYKMPEGEFRNFADYFSIQEQFPAIYGINRFGVPESAPKDVKARAKQLKGYLLVFEQIMANFLANLQNAPRLFSTDKDLTNSYFDQILTDQNGPDIEKLYNRKYRSKNGMFEKILKKYDNFADRRIRALNYMLALYGEKFTQTSLRNFNFYFKRDSIDGVLIENKINFLRNLPEINRKKASGFDYRQLSWDNEKNLSGFRMKVNILLGLSNNKKRSLTEVFTNDGLTLISDDQLRELERRTVDLEFVGIDNVNEYIEREFSDILICREEREDFVPEAESLISECILLKNNLINESFLQHGIYPDRYKLGCLDNSKSHQLLFRPDKDTEWSYVATYEDKEEAIAFVNILQRYLIKLNLLSEGFHIVEHVLLRPDGKHTFKKPGIPRNFYSLKMSVIFPDWTARFSNKRFRLLAEETVRMNCPAHIYPEIHWFNFDEMVRFETVYKKWHEEKMRCGKDNKKLDGYSKEIIEILISHG
ncbi:MAG: hypothetical protein GY941_08320 [Planctomycetes bacterium]|nr:hypothetical protein [Planctomycetota bacterium]